jgi:hypothetical protein
MSDNQKSLAVLADARRLLREVMQETATGSIGIKTLWGLPLAIGMLDSLVYLMENEGVVHRDAVQ